MEEEEEEEEEEMEMEMEMEMEDGTVSIHHSHRLHGLRRHLRDDGGVDDFNDLFEIRDTRMTFAVGQKQHKEQEDEEEEEQEKQE